MNMQYAKGRGKTIALRLDPAHRETYIKFAKAGLITIYMIAAAVMAFSQG